MDMNVAEIAGTNVNGSTGNLVQVSSPPDKVANNRTVEPTNTSEQDSQKAQNSSDNKLTREDAQKFVESLYDMAEILQTKLNFSVSEDTNDIVINVVNKDTDEVIRQIPPKEMQKLQARMREMTGILLNENV